MQGPRAEDHGCLGPQLLPDLVQWEPLCDQTVQREVKMNFDHFGSQHDTPGSSPRPVERLRWAPSRFGVSRGRRGVTDTQERLHRMRGQGHRSQPALRSQREGRVGSLSGRCSQGGPR